MATFGDKPFSRYKFGRLFRRSLQIIASILIVLLLALLAVMFALRSETFWKRAIFGRIFGPYWETCISWDRFEPEVLPLGLRIRKLSVHEPNNPGQPFLVVNEVNLQLSSTSWFDRVVVKELELSGVEVSLVEYPNGQSNLGLIQQRLFEGKISDVGRRGFRDEQPTLPAILIRPVELESLGFRYQDQGMEQPLVIRFRNEEPLEIGAPNGSGRRFRMDQAVQLSTVGLMEARMGDNALVARTEVRLDATRLGFFPRSNARLHVELRSVEGGETRVRLDGDVPLDRAGIRWRALPLRDLDAQLLAADGAELMSATDLAFDPLTGELAARVVGKGDSTRLADSLLALCEPATRQRLGKRFRASHPGMLATAVESPFQYDMDAQVRGRGLLQYAIVDPAERLPLDVVTSGTLVLHNVDATGLEGLAQILGNAEEGHGDGSIPAEFVYTWYMSADERARLGEIFLSLRAWPGNLQPGDFVYTATVSDADDPRQAVRLNPFAPGSWDSFTSATLQSRANLPLYPAFPNYERGLEYLSGFLGNTLTIFDAFQMQDAQFRQELRVGSPRLMQRMAGLFLRDVEGASAGEFSARVARLGPGQPSLWSLTGSVERINLAGIPEPIAIQADMRVRREGSRFLNEETVVSLGLPAKEGGTPRGLQLRASLPAGAAPGAQGVSSLDTATGDLHLEVSMETVDAASLEILSRVKLLSGRLAISEDPAIARLIEIVGLGGDAESSGASGRLQLVTDLGRELRIWLAASLDGVPARNVPFIPQPMLRDLKTLQARLIQESVIQRETGSLVPSAFSVEVSRPDLATPFATLRLAPGEGVVLDAAAVKEVLLREAEELAAAVPPAEGSVGLRQVGDAYFSRLAAIDETMEQGAGTLTLELKENDLGPWAPILREFGIPLEGGEMEVRLASPLSPLREGSDSVLRADGTFTISKARIAQFAEPIPLIKGTFQMARRDGRIYIDDFSSFVPSAADPATGMRLYFQGETDLATGADQWALSIRGANAEALAALRNITTPGISAGIQVLDQLPTGQLLAATGHAAAMDVTLRGRPGDAPGETILDILQQGSNLVVLPQLFSPLAFTVHQRATTNSAGASRLDAVEMQVSQVQPPLQLFKASLVKPVPLSPTGESTVSLAVSREALNEAPPVRDWTLPWLGTEPLSGNLVGTLGVRVPAVSGAVGAPQESTLDFDLSLQGVGFPHRPGVYTFGFQGAVRRHAQEFRIEDFAGSALSDGEPAGRFTGAAVYTAAEHNANGQITLDTTGQRLLRIFPASASQFFASDDSRFHADLAFDDRNGGSEGSVRFAASAANLRLPGTMAADSTAPPALGAHLAAETTFDRQTGIVSLQSLSADIVRGRWDAAAATVPPNELERLATVRQSEPIVYNYRSDRLSVANPEGAGLVADIGPAELADFAPWLSSVATIPISQGTLRGRFTLRSVGTIARRVENAEGSLTLSDAIWNQADGSAVPFEGEFLLLGGSRGQTIRFDEVSARVLYRSGEIADQDHLLIRGYAEDTGPGGTIDMELLSDGMDIGRLLSFARDVRLLRMNRVEAANAGPPPAPPPQPVLQSDDLLTLTQNLKANVRGRLNSLRYRELVIPSATLRLQAIENRVLVDELRAETGTGTIIARGTIDGQDPGHPWRLTVTTERVEASPWVNALAGPRLNNMLRGKLSLNGEFKGRGFSTTGLATNLVGSLTFGIDDGAIADPVADRLFGPQTALLGQGQAFIRNNNLRFRFTTPWNPEYDLSMRGTLRPAIPIGRTEPYLDALVNYARTTDVGPAFRRIEHRGREVRPRQELYGMSLEISGPAFTRTGPSVQVRTYSY